jgi:hypothetical protein
VHCDSLDRSTAANLTRQQYASFAIRFARVSFVGGVAAATLLLAGAALAQDAAPANTLMDLQRQLSACMGGKPLGPAGSRLTIMLMMKRDGSIFGKPRVTFSHLEGDADARRRFVDDAERAVEACLPFRITPSLGGAIAGRPFVITLGRSKPEQRI